MKSLALTRGAALTGVLMLTHTSVALAAGGESTPFNFPTKSTGTHPSAGSGSNILQTLIALLVVIAVIYGVSWLLRRAKGGGSRASGEGLEQIASLPLGNGRSVALIRAGQEVHLIGIADQGVTQLRTYTEAEALSLGLDPGLTYGASLQTAERPLGRITDALRRRTIR